MVDADVVVIGGGIAGVSVAYELTAADVAVVVVEAESVLAHHTTGRSAALLVDSLGTAATWPLTDASRAWFEEPPDGLVDHPLLTPRGVLTPADGPHLDELDRLAAEAAAAGTPIERLDATQAMEMVPVLAPEWVSAALWEPEPSDIDVAASHQAFVRGLARAHGTILTDARVTAIESRPTGWQVHAGPHVMRAETIVNAAGAWGDEVAAMAGAAPVGLVPLRRTAFTVNLDTPQPSWPMVHTADTSFYFRPEGAGLLCSLADETPDQPCDVRPRDLDVALAIDRINAATTLGIRSVRRAWAGLRTFAADRTMVIGPDPHVDGFVWLVGQGGTGIQTAPAAARLARSQVLGEVLPNDLAVAGVDVVALSASRFRG